MLKVNTRGNIVHFEDIILVFQKHQTNLGYYSFEYAIKPMRNPDARLSVLCESPFKLCLFIVGKDDMTSSTAEVTITIRDVNDEAPTFNQQEYRYHIYPANRIASIIITNQRCER